MCDNEELKRIVAIHDISGLGKCSLTVALPVVSASGVECSCIPTALLSTHTGEFEGWTLRDLSDEMLPIAEHWKSEGARFDGIYSGYLATPEQADIVGRIIRDIRSEHTMVAVDPAMADNGEYYANMDDKMCRAFRRLCALADIITPNVTEAALLTDMECRAGEVHDEAYIAELLSRLNELGARVVAITGVRPTPSSIGVVVRDFASSEEYRKMRPAREGAFYGTGDIFASAFCALMVREFGVKNALEAASFLVAESIELSCKSDKPRRFGVDFERVLPSYIDLLRSMK